MSINILKLVKKFGNQKAVNDITFHARKGEITGFLGPNGAGKSTTMKIATSYLMPTSGSVQVAGLDVLEQPLEVRKKLGYLPEHNPLYLDMYVWEYLRFIARIHGLPNVEKRIMHTINQCGLEREQHKMIGSLSKGYRQRVGLAQALIHDPEVLILDEPTTGLDPNQIIEIREVIRAVSREKTVLLSTHILQEVKAICNRVIIINRGKLIVNKPIQELEGESHTKQVKARFNKPVELEAFKHKPLLKDINYGDDQHNLLINTAHNPDQIQLLIYQVAAEQQLPLLELKAQEKTNDLESIFRSLTTSNAANDSAQPVS